MGPHCHKSCSQVYNILGNHRDKHIQSTMDQPHPGKTTSAVISTLPGKYTTVQFLKLESFDIYIYSYMSHNFSYLRSTVLSFATYAHYIVI